MMKQRQFNLEMNPPKKTERNKLPEAVRAANAEKEEAHRCFKLHKSGRPWIFSDKEKKLLKKYYGIAA